MQRLFLPVISFLSGALVFGIAGAIGLWLTLEANGVPAFWPGNGLMVVLILTLGVGQAAFALLGATLGGLALQFILQSGPMGLALTLSDLTEVAVIVYAANRVRLPGSGLETVFSIVALVAILSVGTALSALGAAATLAWFRDIDYADSLQMLWRLNAISALIILAPYFALVRPGRLEQLRVAFRERRLARFLEYLAIVAVLVASLLIMREANVSMVSFLTVPLIWCAIRFGPPATAVTGSVLSLLIILLLISGQWPATGSLPSLAWQLQRIELGLSFSTIPPLFVAAAMAGLYRAARELKLSQQRLRYALAGSGEGVWDWCLATNETYFSDGWYAILGYQRHELAETAATWDELRHPDDTAENRRRVRDHLEGKTPRYSIEQRFRHKDGHWVWVLDRGSVVEFDTEGRPYRAVGTLQDISRRRARQDELDRRAHHDPLTGLANRAALSDSFERWRAEGRSFWFVLIDLDDFKPINDRFGHQFGDHALVAIADRIRACLDAGDIAARIGGDEFALLVHAPQADAERVAMRLVERISEPIGFADSVIITGASIGIARVSGGVRDTQGVQDTQPPQDAQDFLSAYRRADIALYDAKAGGGSDYRFADAPREADQSHPERTQSALLAVAHANPADHPARNGKDAADDRHG